MHREFTRFLEMPARATYLAARSAWLQLNVQPLTAADLQVVAELLNEGEYVAVIEHVHAWQARAAFSPRAHYFAAEAHAAVDQWEEAEVERWAFSACLAGILATGDGTRRKPYVIAQVPDEYDVLKLQGLTSLKQRLVQRGRRSCDVISCDDGSQLWFNVSDLVAVPVPQVAEPVALVDRIRVDQARPGNNRGIIRTKRRISDPLRIAPR